MLTEREFFLHKTDRMPNPTFLMVGEKCGAGAWGRSHHHKDGQTLRMGIHQLS